MKIGVVRESEVEQKHHKKYRKTSRLLENKSSDDYKHTHVHITETGTDMDNIHPFRGLELPEVKSCRALSSLRHTAYLPKPQASIVI